MRAIASQVNRFVVLTFLFAFVLAVAPVTLASRCWEAWHFGPSQSILRAGRRWRKWLSRTWHNTIISTRIPSPEQNSIQQEEF